MDVWLTRSRIDVESCPSLAEDNERMVVGGKQIIQHLRPEYVSSCRGKGGRILAYAKGHK